MMLRGGGVSGGRAAGGLPGAVLGRDGEGGTVCDLAVLKYLDKIERLALRTVYWSWSDCLTCFFSL